MMESEVMGNYHASFGERDGETRTVRIVKVRTVPTPRNMPWLPDLAVSEAPGAALTEAQYKRMERWAQGKFDADWPGAEPVPTPLDKFPEQDRPQALDRAA